MLPTRASSSPPTSPLSSSRIDRAGRMAIEQLRRLGFAVAFAAWAMATIYLLQACSFGAPNVQSPQDVYDILDAAPYVDPTVAERWTVMEEAGKIKVEHGRSCAGAPRAASEEYVRVGVSIEDFRYELAPGASNGTLTYTVRTKFSDKDGYPGMSDRFQVDVLGINLLSPVIVE